MISFVIVDAVIWVTDLTHKGGGGAVAPPPQKKMPKKKEKRGREREKKEDKVACMREAAAFQPFPK